ncbi:MAG: hypothetical protein WA970_03560 [Gammaproteobacteria bacterium]
MLDYGARWAIEPAFLDFKSRGFELEDSQLEHPERLERLILIMALAMYWCVCGWAEMRPYITQQCSKKTQERSDPNHRSFRKLYRSMVSGFKCGLRHLKRCLQTDQPLPAFHAVMNN